MLAVLAVMALAGPRGMRLHAEDGAIIRFSWAVLYSGSDEVVRAIDYSRLVVRLASGDRVRFIVRPESRCYFYLVLHDAQKNLLALFPRSSAFWGSGAPMPATWILPEGDSWYRLDANPGIELFYLIVSDHRLLRLEAAIEDYRADNRSSRREALTYGVLDEIRTIIRDTSELAEAAQKPIAVAGDLRGIREETRYNGMSIVARETYVRAIRLEH